jgi:hypothetical protein
MSTHQLHLGDVAASFSLEEAAAFVDRGLPIGIRLDAPLPTNFTSKAFSWIDSPRVASETVVCINYPYGYQVRPCASSMTVLFRPVAAICECGHAACLAVCQSGTHLLQDFLAIEGDVFVSSILHSVPLRSGVINRAKLVVPSHRCRLQGANPCTHVIYVRVVHFPPSLSSEVPVSPLFTELRDHADARVQNWAVNSNFTPFARQSSVLHAMRKSGPQVDRVLVLPTAFGKTFLVAGPAFCRRGVTLVIAPAVTLIKDAIDTFNKAAGCNDDNPLAVRLDVKDQNAAFALLVSCLRGDDTSPRILYATPDFVVYHMYRTYSGDQNVAPHPAVWFLQCLVAG